MNQKVSSPLANRGSRGSPGIQDGEVLHVDGIEIVCEKQKPAKAQKQQDHHHVVHVDTTPSTYSPSQQSGITVSQPSAGSGATRVGISSDTQYSTTCSAMDVAYASSTSTTGAGVNDIGVYKFGEGIKRDITEDKVVGTNTHMPIHRLTASSSPTAKMSEPESSEDRHRPVSCSASSGGVPMPTASGNSRPASESDLVCVDAMP